MCYTVGRKGADGVGDRIILHCDLNCFYASVELLEHPELRGAPAAVCGDPRQRHGVILAKNEAAKAAGVRTGESVWQASQRCPGLHLLPAHHEKYRHYSRLVNEVYQSYTDRVERFGIDESWLDVTGTLHLFGGDAGKLADAIRARVRETFGLTLSVGVSFNKVFAKLGSDYRKPDATTVISRENWREIVWPLPVGSILFAGPAAQKALAQYGIRTLGQLAAADLGLVEGLLGKMGRQLWRCANGLDDAPVRPQHEKEPVKSVGNSSTFPDNLTTRDQVRRGAARLCDSVAARLRQQGLYCRAVQVGLRDPSFHNISRQKHLGHSTHLMRELLEAAMELIDGLWRPPSPIRLISVTALDLTDTRETYEQTDLFAPDQPALDERRERLEQAVDNLRAKYGRQIISFGEGTAGPLSHEGGEEEPPELKKP